ncbi:AbrB family transcriptional regulator [Pseudomonas sp.]|uniref:AbrB family transcriptional regulator n=1 Tax=Pseudomonas sp. TaxID=306 RepID=UPI0028A6CCAE|nr:AbrB family transcriptional regulator [Pseudomonas sp.]
MHRLFPRLTSTPLQWLMLVLAAGVAGQWLHRWQVPAGLFLGPMLAAIACALAGMKVRVHRHGFRFGQGCVGLLVAHSMTWPVVHTLVQSWYQMLGATLLTLTMSALIGIGAMRFSGLSKATAAWGTAPGAASAMVAMSEEYGADARVVATMQYVRVVCVVLVGAWVSHVLGAQAPVSGAAAMGKATHLSDFALSLGVIVVGVAAGTRVPAGALLVPLLLGAVLQLSGLLTLDLPGWVFGLGYGLIGCYIGLRFDRGTVAYVSRQMPAMLLSASLLIALCAGCAWCLAKALDIDFLSMYLATSPGGLDAMAILAVETHADTGFVLASQTLRLFCVVLVSVLMARYLPHAALPAKKTGRSKSWSSTAPK